MLASASILALLLDGCTRKTAEAASGAPEVGVVTVSEEPVPLTSELTGRITAATASDVRPQVNGVIMARLFQEGSVVRAGQPLYQIDPRLYRAARDQAAAQLENAQASLATAQAKAGRYRSLDDAQAVSRQDFDDTDAAARQARANVHQYGALLESARVNLEYTRVLAPIGGRIGRSAVTPGALVTADQSTPLASIQQLDPIYVDITQSSARLLQLRRALARGSVMPASTAVRLKLEDGTVYPQTGKMEFSEVTVDQDAGTVTLRARFPNPDGLLLPGMFVRVQAPQAVIPKGVLVPQQGVTRDAKGNATALVVEAGNKVALRTVVADRAVGDKWLVTTGLLAGDKLIVEGVDKVEPGSVVKPVSVLIGR